MASTKLKVDNAKKLLLAAAAANCEVGETLDFGVHATVEVKFKDASQIFEMGRLYNSEIQEPKKTVVPTQPVK
jgi:hypothetical protein